LNAVEFQRSLHAGARLARIRHRGRRGGSGTTAAQQDSRDGHSEQAKRPARADRQGAPREHGAAAHADPRWAERLFAARGFHGVSIRDITGAAGRRRWALANYHFGESRGCSSGFPAAAPRLNAERLARRLAAEMAGRRGRRR